MLCGRFEIFLPEILQPSTEDFVSKAVSGEKIVDMLKVEAQLKEGQFFAARRTIGFLDN